MYVPNLVFSIIFIFFYFPSAYLISAGRPSPADQPKIRLVSNLNRPTGWPAWFLVSPSFSARLPSRSPGRCRLLFSPPVPSLCLGFRCRFLVVLARRSFRLPPWGIKASGAYGSWQVPLYSLQLPLSASSLRCYSGRFWSPGVVACACAGLRLILEPPSWFSLRRFGRGSLPVPGVRLLTSARLSLSVPSPALLFSLPLPPSGLLRLCAAFAFVGLRWSLSQVFQRASVTPAPAPSLPPPRPRPLFAPCPVLPSIS